MGEHAGEAGGGREGEREMWLLRSVGEEAAGWRREGEQRHEDKCALSFPNRDPCNQRLARAAATQTLKISALLQVCAHLTFYL